MIGDPAATGLAWQVATDGTASGPGLHPRRRLCVLDEQAGTDLIRLIRLSRRSVIDNRDPIDPAPTAPPPADSADRREPRPALDQPAARLRLLGGCQLTIHYEPVALRRSAGLQILAYLALHPDGGTTSDLIRAVWPGLPPNTITNRLHTTLSDLRKQLHPLLGDDPITRHDDRYHLNHRAVDTDLAAVHAVIQAATEDQRRSACRALVHAYPGDLAAGYAWPWLQPVREALRPRRPGRLSALGRHGSARPGHPTSAARGRRRAPIGRTENRFLAGQRSAVLSSLVAEAAFV
jgi:hypothetical protein